MDRQARAVVEAVDRAAGELQALLQEMVRFPSVSHPPGGDEGPFQRFMAAHYRDMGLEVDVFLPTDVPGIQAHEGFWPWLDYTDRPNVVGVWKGAGGGRSLILNGHADVVHEGPRALWHHEPYGGEVEGGRLYGRGAADMKGGIAAMTMAVAALKRCDVRLQGDVILQSVVNEEMGGYNGTLACICRGYEADAAIVTEPTQLKLEPATKGVQGYGIAVPGKGAHTGFWWEGVSALDNAIYIKQAIEAFAALRQQQTRHIPLYDDPSLFPIPAVTDCVYAFSAGQPDLMGVPAQAHMELMIDILPGEQLEEVTQAFETHIRNACAAHPFLKENPVTISPIDMRPIYPTRIAEEHPVVAAMQAGAQAVLGRPGIVCGFEAACDAMMFNLYSATPAMVFGPGSLKQAHRPDEFIEVDELIQATKILALAMMDFCGVA